MPLVDIFRLGTKIDSAQFRSGFMVVQLEDGELVWKADRETAAKESGRIVIWFRCTHPPQVHFVPPGWTLVVDGNTVVNESTRDPEARLDIPIKGRIAELHHGDLSFVFRQLTS